MTTIEDARFRMVVSAHTLTTNALHGNRVTTGFGEPILILDTAHTYQRRARQILKKIDAQRGDFLPARSR
ncbi:hypothetical protein [Paraburkholderia podalyriae]|uniref:Uncharacterized protein n=1 Tax=Paraburkholderia podalyriae TaxID=1938811 RepID=A0ABR7PWS0_9BURK|nr:hypothetical protein [Paraburkholderia podalyriae]MBC8750732.1 hypothetical protein [Paraburkholderia podalyriae]